MKKIWIIEDKEEILSIITKAVFMASPEGYEIVSSPNCDNVILENGDIAILDQNGVNLPNLVNNGGKIISMSGDPTLDVTLHKPFKMNQLVEEIRKIAS